MAWNSEDVAQSIRRSIQMILPQKPDGDWTHRLERREVKVEDRPVSVTMLGNSSVTSARETLDQGEITTLYAVTIYGYPVVGASPREARAEGDNIRDSIHNLIRFGMPRDELLKDDLGRPKSGPYRMPLWDFEGINFEAPEGPGNQLALPHDVIWVDQKSVSAQNLADADDDCRRSVVVEMRVTVESPGRTDQIGPAVTGLPGTGTFG